MISVCIVGAAGRMGREIVKAVHNDAQTKVSSAIGRSLLGQDVGIVSGIGEVGITLESDLVRSIESSRPDVAVDVSLPAVVKTNAQILIEHGIAPVIGATGLSERDLAELDVLAKSHDVPVLVAPNFAIGAILMMRFATEAAKYFEMAEIIEYHHEKKLDAPSGTAFKTALLLREAKGEDFTHVGGDGEDSNAPHARGGQIGGVAIHAVRLPGFLAHQEVIFGMAGQTLTIKHDTITRECYMPGVLLAIKRVRELEAGVTFGLETIL